MNKNHFEHVRDHFDLMVYSPCNNRAFHFLHIYDLTLLQVSLGERHPSTYFIRTTLNRVLFQEIPTREFAEDIVQYIKDTEMLFI